MKARLLCACAFLLAAGCAGDPPGSRSEALKVCIVEVGQPIPPGCPGGPGDPGGSCGDGVCGPDETPQSCPGDCPGDGDGDDDCGDGVCGPDEDPTSCPDDCDPCNGDGTCQPGEAGHCPEECPCDGDGECDPGETGASCPDDCDDDCGDGECGPDEDADSCPTDCPCDDDGECEPGDPGETSETCPGDCPCNDDGVCDPGEEGEACPGDCECNDDGVCDPGEDSDTCPGDCAECGNGTCEAGEEATCANDCGPCNENGVCDADETAATCNDCNDQCTVPPARTPGNPPRDERGCPLDPTCADRDSNDELCLGPCVAKCRRVYQRHNFWVSNYNVAETLGNGEHQGIMTTSSTYSYDPRLPWSVAGAPAQPWRRNGRKWRYGDGTDGPTQLGLRLLNPAGETEDATPISGTNQVSEAYMCQAPQQSQRLIGNHGRTLARAFSPWRTSPYRRMIPMRLLASAAESADGPRVATCARLGQVSSCVGGVQDGYCDTQCGNCSYVIPAEGRGAVAPPGAFPLPPVRLIETMRSVYYGRRNGPVQLNGEWFQSPFASCVAPGVLGPQEGVTSRVGWIANGRRVATGWWGHNSNTDAKAEYQHFTMCEDAPSADRLLGVCNLCGTPRAVSGREQYPCLDRTNEARSKWDRTDGIHNIDTDALGGGGPGAPTCRRGGIVVHGM